MYLIQYPEVKGDFSIAKFKDCFKALSVEYECGRSAVQAPIGSSARDIGTKSFSPIRITKILDKSSQSLQESCIFGKSVECKIYFLDSNNTEYLEIVLTNALFSNYNFKAHAEEIPQESFDITYTAISCRYTLRDGKGLPGSSSSTTFNLTANTK